MGIDGYCDSHFQEVRRVFETNFDQGAEIGAAVAVYHEGKSVVDLAIGLKDRLSGQLYTRDTLQPVFSVTKGITALAACTLVDRGRLDLDAPVSHYWPEFAAAGKEKIPVRWLLTHQSGVLGLDRQVSLNQLLDWGHMIGLIAAQKPAWEPGREHGYHSMTYGFLVGEVIRRVSGYTVGQYLAREITCPLDADFFVGLPKAQNGRVAPVLLEQNPTKPPKLADSGPFAARTLNWISPPLTPFDLNREDVRAAEIPAANGIGNARSLARILDATITEVDGVRLLSPSALDLAREEQWRGMDVVMGIENAVGLGFLLPTPWCPLAGPGSFGTAGFGGSRAWAHPELELAFGYTPNLCSLEHYDPREVVLSKAVVTCAKRIRN